MDWQKEAVDKKQKKKFLIKNKRISSVNPEQEQIFFVCVHLLKFL